VRDVEEHRPRLFALAYRMLGTRSDAEDVVQDVFARWYAAPHDEVREPAGWLVTSTTRACIDRLRTLATERRNYPGPWLPEPLVGPAPLADDLSVAFLLLLERLAPDERAAFLLHTAFEYPHADIAELLGKSEPNVRQMVHRARARIVKDRPHRAPDPERARALVERFVTAWRGRDQAALLEVLATDVTLTSDGGGRVSAATRTVFGADRVSRFLFGVGRKWYAADTLRVGLVGGTPGVIRFHGGAVKGVIAVECDADHVAAIYSVLNPEKLPST